MESVRIAAVLHIVAVYHITYCVDAKAREGWCSTGRRSGSLCVEGQHVPHNCAVHSVVDARQQQRHTGLRLRGRDLSGDRGHQQASELPRAGVEEDAGGGVDQVVPNALDRFGRLRL
mgnify:CR=1 FL=1